MAMEHSNVFQLTSQEFEKAGIPFLVVGGWVVNYYGVSRTTGDLDFLMVEGGYDKVFPILQEAGYEEVSRDRLCARLKNERVFFISVDILFTERETLLEMLNEAKDAEIHGQKFKVPSLKHLMAMKLHSLKQTQGERDYKDLLDILDLAKQNQVDTQSLEFQDLCLKYGSQDLYQKIRGFC